MSLGKCNSSSFWEVHSAASLSGDLLLWWRLLKSSALKAASEFLQSWPLGTMVAPFVCVVLMTLAFLLCSQLSLDVSAKRTSPAILSVQFLFVFCSTVFLIGFLGSLKTAFVQEVLCNLGGGVGGVANASVSCSTICLL